MGGALRPQHVVRQAATKSNDGVRPDEKPKHAYDIEQTEPRPQAAFCDGGEQHCSQHGQNVTCRSERVSSKVPRLRQAAFGGCPPGGPHGGLSLLHRHALQSARASQPRRAGNGCRAEEEAAPVKTLLQRLNEISPSRCRIAAQQRGRPITQLELSVRIGWSKTKVIRVSRLKAWDTLSIADCQKWASACGLRLPRLKSDFYHRLRRTKLVFSKLKESQRRMYGRLMK